MPRWLVYVGETYYPFAEIVEADSPEAAARLVGSHGNVSDAWEDVSHIWVTPADDLTVFVHGKLHAEHGKRVGTDG